MRFKIKYNILAYIVLVLSLLSYLFEGLSIALMHNAGLYLSSSPMTVFRYFLFPIALVVIFNSKYFKLDSRFKLLLILFIISVFMKLLIQLNNPLLEIKSLLNYLSPIFIASLILVLSKEQSQKIFNIFIVGAIISAVIALFQAFVPDLLSQSFVNPPQLDQSSLKSVDLIYDFVKMRRPNGLIGNAIEFGFLMNTVLFIVLLRNYKNVNLFISILLVLVVSVVTTLSRAAIMQTLILLMGYFILFLNSREKVKSIVVISLSLIVLVSYLDTYFELIFNYIEFTTDRIFSSEGSAEASNYEHQKDYLNSWKVLKDNILLGLPIGTNKGSETIITDGTWFHLILELGLITFLLFILLTFRLVKVFLQDFYKKHFALIYFALLIIVGFLNSGLISKLNYFVFFLILFSSKNYFNNVKDY